MNPFRAWVDATAKRAGLSATAALNVLVQLGVTSTATAFALYGGRPLRNVEAAERISAHTGLTIETLLGFEGTWEKKKTSRLRRRTDSPPRRSKRARKA